MSFCNEPDLETRPTTTENPELQALRNELEHLFTLSPSLSPSLQLLTQPSLNAPLLKAEEASLPQEALLSSLLREEFGEKQGSKLLQLPAFRRRLEEAKNSLFSVAWQPRTRKPKLFVVPKPPSA
jgi:hypothetical protein